MQKTSPFLILSAYLLDFVFFQILTGNREGLVEALPVGTSSLSWTCQVSHNDSNERYMYKVIDCNNFFCF